MRLAPTAYLAAMSLLLASSFLVFQVIVKRAYLRRGQLGALLSLLQTLMWGPFFCFPYLYNPPHWAWFWSHPHPAGRGVLLIALLFLAAGLVPLVVAMTQLGLARSVGRGRAALHERGLYRRTRNPQIVAGVLLVIGLALLWPSWYAVGWVAMYLAMAHMMVRAEEAHLGHRHGSDFVRYRERVPRYVGLPRRNLP